MSNLEDLLAPFKNSSSEDDEESAPSGFSADKPYSPPPGMAMPTVKTTVAPPSDDDSEEEVSHPSVLGGSPRPVQDYMARLAAAQSQAADNRQRTGITAGLAQLVHGISGAAGQADVSGILSQGKANDNAPIQAIMDQKSAMQMQKEADSEDPTSEASKTFRAGIKGSLPQFAAALGDQFDQLTPANADKLLKPFELKQSWDSKKEIAADKTEDRADSRSAKQSADQDKAYTEATKAMQSFRGNKAVQNASEALRNSDSAMALINSKADPNSFTNEQYNTIVAEMAKIATGGAATEGSIHDAKASSLQSKAAAFMQSVSGKPTPAQMGEFIAQNKEYLQHLNDVNHKYVDDYRRQIGKGFKHRLSADDYQELQNDNFPDRAPGAGNMGPAQTPGAAGPTPPPPHPQDSVAVQWAKNNLNDPRAKAILKANGIQ